MPGRKVLCLSDRLSLSVAFQQVLPDENFFEFKIIYVTFRVRRLDKICLSLQLKECYILRPQQRT